MSKQREQFFLYIDGEAISVTEEVYETFWHYTNKEDYFMRQLKRVRRVRDRKEEKWVYVPARERSLEEFLESQESTKFISEEFESSILSGFWFESVLETLTEEEKEIVREFYINGKTERAACAVLGIPKTTFRRREKNLRKKLGQNHPTDTTYIRGVYALLVHLEKQWDKTPFRFSTQAGST